MASQSPPLGPRPTLRQLEYLVAVADHLHFRRAAEAVAVSQPGLSSQIQQLEELLGVTLFERTRRKVILTPAGVEAVAHARQVLADTDRLIGSARQASRPLCGPLWMGVIPTIAPYLLPHALPAVRRAHPDLQLYLREDQTARLVERLEAGKLDLLLLALPVEGARAETLPLYEEPFVVAMPPDHPLASRAVLKQADLDGQVVLLLEDGHCLRDDAMAVCRAAGAREADQVRATSLGTLTQMVANGLGITLLPQLATDVEVTASSRIVVRPFAAPPPTRSIGLMWRQASGRGEEFRTLGKLIQAQVERRIARTRPRGAQT